MKFLKQRESHNESGWYKGIHTALLEPSEVYPVKSITAEKTDVRSLKLQTDISKGLI